MFLALCILSPLALVKPAGNRRKDAFSAISGPNVRCERREETGRPLTLPLSSWSGPAGLRVLSTYIYLSYIHRVAVRRVVVATLLAPSASCSPSSGESSGRLSQGLDGQSAWDGGRTPVIGGWRARRPAGRLAGAGGGGRH